MTRRARGAHVLLCTCAAVLLRWTSADDHSGLGVYTDTHNAGALQDYGYGGYGGYGYDYDSSGYEYGDGYGMFYGDGYGYYGGLTNFTSFCSEMCPTDWLKDGMCDRSCYSEECSFDGGDCEGLDMNSTGYYYGGSGNGGQYYYYFPGSNGSSTFESLWDEYFYGDNSTYYGSSSSGEEEDWTLCNDQCLSSWVGDSFCDLECDVEECSFDGGDCVTSNATTTGLFDDDGDFQPSCSKGCLPAFQGDFVCDPECNNAECSFDNGDCESEGGDGGDGDGDGEADSLEGESDADASAFGDAAPEDEIAAGSEAAGYYGDFKGDGATNGDEYYYEPNADECSVGCPTFFLGDQFCDELCNNAACRYDEGDCAAEKDLSSETPASAAIAQQATTAATTALKGSDSKAAAAAAREDQVRVTKPMQSMQDVGVRPDEEGDDGGDDGGSSAVVGQVVGGLVAVVALAGIAMFMVRSYSARRRTGGGGVRHNKLGSNEMQSITSAQDDQDDFI